MRVSIRRRARAQRVKGVVLVLVIVVFSPRKIDRDLPPGIRMNP
jgi:hypothetical protein